MDEQNDVWKKIATAKLWNSVLSDSLEEKVDANFIDLDNYVARMNILVLGKNENKFEKIQLDKLIHNCDIFVQKNSQLQNYTSTEHEKLIQLMAKQKKNDSTNEVTEIFDISDGCNNKDTKIALNQSKNVAKKRKTETTNSSKQINNESTSTIHQVKSREDFIQLLISIKNAINGSMTEKIKALLVDLLVNYDSSMIAQFCHNLIDFESPADKISEQITNVTLTETQLSCLILNLSPTQISYNVSSAYLKYLLSDYVLARFRIIHVDDQIEGFYSRVMMGIFEYLLKEFSRQFIRTCLTVWAIESNSINQENKGIVDFTLKIINDFFSENDSSIMLSCLLGENTNNTIWCERFYGIVTTLIEKGNLCYENAILLINKMQQDSVILTKSSIFSKCLLLVLNKLKASFSENINTKVAQSTSNSTSSQASVDVNAFSKFPNKIDANLLNTIEIIIGNNQTIMKKTLSKVLNTFKS